MNEASETLSEEILKRLGTVAQNLAALQEHCYSRQDEDAFLLTRKTLNTMQEIRARLEEAGQAIPPMPSAGLDVPLHLLDTPTNRRYLEALTEAHRCALAVDYERGYGDDGLAQDLEDLCCAVRMEIFGTGKEE